MISEESTSEEIKMANEYEKMYNIISLKKKSKIKEQ